MLLRRLALIALLALVAPLARADDVADPTLVGRAGSVVADVRARAVDGKERVLQADDLLRFQEQVITGREGKTTIVFRDGSTLELGPEAAVTIDKMVYDPQSGTNEKKIAISRGLFRFVSGTASPANRTEIRTPVGTAGIRGSVLSGWVNTGSPLILIGGYGAFVFTNSAGSINFNGGQAIGINDANSSPIPPERMPVVLVAIVVQNIQQRLGSNPPPVPPAGPNAQRTLARANTVPAGQQQQGQNRPIPPLPILAALPLPPQLAQAVAAGLLSGAQNLTPQQQALLQQFERQNPAAGRIVTGFYASQTNLHHQNQQTANRDVQVGLALVLSPAQLAAVQAQLQRPAHPQSIPLPPALAAALQSGNPAAITALIQQLSGGDPARAAALAQAVVSAAEQMVATNPDRAVQLARLAVQVVRDMPTQTAAPPQVASILEIAARIAIIPEVLRVNPTASAELSVQLAQIASSPVIYGVDPQGAITVMAIAYQVAGDRDVRNTGQGSLSEVARILASAAMSGQLNTNNPANFAQIEDILGRTLVFLVYNDREHHSPTSAHDPYETPMRHERPDRAGSPS